MISLKTRWSCWILTLFWPRQLHGLRSLIFLSPWAIAGCHIFWSESYRSASISCLPVPSPSAAWGWCAGFSALHVLFHRKSVPEIPKMRRQLHPWPIFSAQNLEQLQVFAFVLGLNMCLAISQSYLRCRGVVRLHNLAQPVTFHRWIACLQKAPLPPSFRLV